MPEIKETVHVLFSKDSSQNWSQDPEINSLFLRTMENWAVDFLHARGHIFLNDIYDQLGLPRTSQGAISGWLLSSGNTPKFWNRELEVDDKGHITLVFITDGVMYDKIEEEA